MQNPVRRLIETDEVPIGQISEHSRKDQNVRKGHLHTLHVWWATRPLAACWAALMATILTVGRIPRHLQLVAERLEPRFGPMGREYRRHLTEEVIR